MSDLKFLNVIAKLADKKNRAQAAKELAMILNAEDLNIFVKDPEINILLPGPGFPQTLQNFQGWNSFLSGCKSGLNRGNIFNDSLNTSFPVVGISLEQAVVVLIGGNPSEYDIQKLSEISPLITALLQEESISVRTKSLAATASLETEKAQRIAKALDGIRKKLNSSYVELNKKNEELTKINNDLDNFIYTASHDLKAPISNLEGLLTAYFEDNNISEDNLPIKEMMFHSVERFKNTIKDLTEISKVQNESGETFENISFEAILAEVKLDIRELIQSLNPTIKTDFKFSEIVYSKRNLRSIIYNLVSNAIKYSSPDRPPIINISTYPQGDYVILKVSDNGLGLTKEQLKKMFTMFKRHHQHVEGTGIGLYIIKRMIENVGGKIKVESELDVGTTVTIYFKV